MNQERWTAVDRYIGDLFAREDEALAGALAASEAAGLPPIAVSPATGKLLQVLARGVGARSILEIGTLGGYSTIWLARALPEEGGAPSGRVVTLEADPKHAALARQNLARAGLAEVVTVREGLAADSLAAMAAAGEGPFDFVFIDADKEGYAAYLDGALSLSRPGTMIVADNVVRGGRVADPAETNPQVEGIRRFDRRLAAEPRVLASEMQTVGVKGYDGLAIAVVVG